jgi:hypothetical protein
MPPKDSIPEPSVLEMLEVRVTPSVFFETGGPDPYGSIPKSELSNISFGEPEIISASELHYLDADGDGVILKFDRDVLTPETLASAFHFEAGERGSYLARIDVAALGDAKALKGLDISVEGVVPAGAIPPRTIIEPHEGWKPLPYIGDQKADIGFINAAGIDLGSVSIEGNLGKIVAGDAKLSTAGLESLTAESLGALGVAGSADAQALTSTITGSLKKLNVAHDINGALLDVIGGKRGDIGDAYVGGDLLGGGFKFSGGILAEGTIKSLVVVGDIHGGSAERSGFLQADGGIKKLHVGGDLLGGSAYGAGRIEAAGIGSVEIAGEVHFGQGAYAGSIYSTKDIKSLTVGEGIKGGSYTGTGSVFADKNIGKIKIAGNLDGGTGEISGYIEAQNRIGSVSVDGYLLGSGGTRSGSIASFDAGIGRIDIGGDEHGYGSASGFISEFINKGMNHHGSGGHGSVNINLGWSAPDYGTKTTVEVPVNGENVTVTQWELPSGPNEATFRASLASFILNFAHSTVLEQGGPEVFRLVGPDGLLSVSDITVGHGFHWPSWVTFSDAGGGNILVTTSGYGWYFSEPWQLVG